MRPSSKLSLKGYALKCLSGREYTRAELRQRLLRAWREDKLKPPGTSESTPRPAAVLSGFGAIDAPFYAAELESSERRSARVEMTEEAKAAIEQALDEMQAKGFLSDARAAEALLHRRSVKLGNARVLQELKAKGVGEDLLRQATQQLKTTELQRAREVWRKKFDAPATLATDRIKQARFLAARGFSADTIQRVMNQGFNDEDF
jgi:regulatory protein